MVETPKDTSKKIIDFNPFIVNEFIIEEDLKKIKACIQCGECSAGCPSGRWSALRTRKLIRKALVGLDSVLSDPDIWLCTTCFTCYERCTRTLPVTEIILKLRNIAVRNGYLLDPLKNVIKNLIEHGHGVPLGGEESTWAQLREFHKLPLIPPTVHKYKKALEEIHKILDTIKFNERIPYQT